MAFELYSDATLTPDVTELGLRAGDVGTVVDRHEDSTASEDGYSVEFLDITSKTVTVAVLRASALRLPTATDVPATRGVSF